MSGAILQWKDVCSWEADTLEKRLFCTAECEGLSIQYYLLVQESTGGMETYGVSVECGEEQDLLPDLTISKWRVSALLEMLARGSVTPVTLRDIVEDWLLA
ncbi:DUF6514 family protein [Oscillibacter sp.]|uniref:DUF6514 family protein n=1 Tax=Oscillibacter sp. TaxID=1945593 RepID=UPI0026127F08|nr:DUF6514 family protein [Oscillibacter sp.]MDD3347139.1 DUF6514 family protein [Oscillibacter sp.]